MRYCLRKRLLFTVCCGGMLWGMTTGYAASANTDEFALDSTVVTATRTIKKRKNVPANVSVITAENIKCRNIHSVPEALQMLPGVYMDQTAQGGIQIRGFDSSDILVLVNGQQINDPFSGSVNWEILPVENIARIEVLRGAASSLYGGHAVGAVVNIFTVENKKKLAVNIVKSYGSNNTHKDAIYINSKINKKISVGIGYENNKSAGYKGYYYTSSGSNIGSGTSTTTLPKLSNGNYVIGGRGEKEWNNKNYSFEFLYKFDKSKSIKYNYLKSRSRYNYKNPFSYIYDKDGKQVFSGKVLTQDGRVVSFSPARFLGYDGKKEAALHTLNYKDQENSIYLHLGYLDISHNGYSSPLNPTSINWSGTGIDSTYPSKTYNIDLQKTWEKAKKHVVVTGLSFDQESFDQKRSYLNNWRNHDSISCTYGLFERHGGKTRNTAVFLQDEYKAADKVTLYTGLRMDYFKKYGGFSKYINADGSFSRVVNHKEGNYTEFSPKIALDYKFNNKVTAYVSYGHSFNPPPLSEVYRYEGGSGGTIANPALAPEVSDTFELGLKKQLAAGTNMNVAVYHTITNDKIVFTRHYVPNTNTVAYKQYENYGKEKRQGIELDLSRKFTDYLKGYFNYAWQFGRLERDKVDNTNITDVSKPDYGIPRHLLHAGIIYDKQKWNTVLECQYVSARQAPDEITGEYGAEDPFFIINTAINYNIAHNAEIQFAIDNIFDRKFYCSEAAAGRSYNISMRYHF